MNKDAELKAIEQTLLLLAPFNKEERARMLAFILSWANDPKTLPPTP